MSERFVEVADDPEMDFEVQADAEAQPRGFDLMAAIGHPNLAFELDESTLTAIGAKVCEEYKLDLSSREAEGYEEKLKRAMSLAKLVREAKSHPWPKASNVKFPLVIKAAIEFNARSYAAVIRGADVYKGSVKGQTTPEKEDRGVRVGRHMSWQVLEEEEDWEEDTDSLLLRLPILGTLVRKTHYDPLLGHNSSHVLGPDEFVVNYRAKRDLSVCPRATHVMCFYPHEILEKRRAGLWLDVDVGQSSEDPNDDQAPHTFLEQHRLWDLDEDGYPEPYIVTVHKETERVVRIVARFYEEDVTVNDAGEVVAIKPYECFTKYGFIPSPDGSFYDIGYGLLLGDLNDTIDTAANQLIDAATLANLQAGFIGGGVSIKSGRQNFQPGEFKKADGGAGPLRDNIVLLPTKEPSAVLYNLMVFLIETAKDLTATQDILSGDAGKGTLPVGTVQALVEQGLKTFTAIVKRIYRAMKREGRVRYKLNGRYLKPEDYFTFQDQPVMILRDDYLAGDLNVVPDADPNMATDLQQMTQAQFVLELVPTGQVDPRKAVAGALRAAKVADPTALMTPEGPPPVDPKVQLEMAKLDLERRRLDIEEGKTAADIANKNALTEQTKLETFLAGPEMAAMLQQAVAAGVQAALALVTNGGNPQVQQPDVPGMAPAPPDAALPPIPPGPALQDDGAMGLDAGGNGPFPPDQGPPDGGAGFAGVG